MSPQAAWPAQPVAYPTSNRKAWNLLVSLASALLLAVLAGGGGGFERPPGNAGTSPSCQPQMAACERVDCILDKGTRSAAQELLWPAPLIPQGAQNQPRDCHAILALGRESATAAERWMTWLAAALLAQALAASPRPESASRRRSEGIFPSCPRPTPACGPTAGTGCTGTQSA